MKVFFFLLCIGIIALAVQRSNNTSSIPSTDTIVESVRQVLPEPTPTDPFIDMTIPYLRTRDYQSQMGGLRQQSKSTTHTTYLTSYTSDNLRIDALLTQPNGEMPDGGWPAIVFVHGYIPPSIYTTTTRYVDHVNALARSGFVVLKIDLRGHGKSEGIPGGAYYSSDYVIDTISAVKALQTLDFVHKERIGLWGHSMAGNVTLRALTARRDIKAVAIWGGAGFTYTDLTTYRIQDNSYRPPQDDSIQTTRRKELFARHGQFDAQNEFWKTVTPANYLSEIQGAIGLFHAADDAVVNVEYSRNLRTLLDATTIPHELHEYPSGGHNISGGAFTQAMQDTVEFYRKYL